MNVQNNQTLYFSSFLLSQLTVSTCGLLRTNARFGWGEAIEVRFYVRNLSLLTDCMATVQHPLTSSLSNWPDVSAVRSALNKCGTTGNESFKKR